MTTHTTKVTVTNKSESDVGSVSIVYADANQGGAITTTLIAENLIGWHQATKVWPAAESGPRVCTFHLVWIYNGAGMRSSDFAPWQLFC
jgi:hypothetical protein